MRQEQDSFRGSASNSVKDLRHGVTLAFLSQTARAYTTADRPCKTIVHNSDASRWRRSVEQIPEAGEDPAGPQLPIPLSPSPKPRSWVRSTLRSQRHNQDSRSSRARYRGRRRSSRPKLGAALPPGRRSRLSGAMSRINSRTSLVVMGRPGRPLRDFLRQYALKPRRCHRTTVTG